MLANTQNLWERKKIHIHRVPDSVIHFHIYFVEYNKSLYILFQIQWSTHVKEKLFTFGDVGESVSSFLGKSFEG